MVRAFDEIPRDTGPRHLLPARGRRRASPSMIVALSRHRDRRPRAAVGGLDAVARAPPRGAPRPPRAPRARGEAAAAYDPGRERRAEQRARELLKSCVNEEEWAMYRDLGFLRVWGGQSRAADGPSGPARRRLRLPDLPAQADRRLPAADRPAAERVLRRVPGRDAALRLAAPARLRRRAREVDGAQGRRAPDHRRGQPAPARPPARPAPDRARPLAARPLGARAPRPRAARRQRAASVRPSPPTA